MERARRHIFFRQARVHGAHDGRAANGIRALAKAQRVANHPAVLGGDSPEGRDGAGEIVRLAFDGHHPAIDKIHAAGVVGEGGNHQRDD